MSVYYREAQNAEEVAKLLRSRGRIVITGPARCGKTTELIRYAEERYPDGRFAVLCKNKEDYDRIIALHWQVANGYTFVDLIAKRLMGEKVLGGKAVNEPKLLSPPQNIYLPNQFIPLFCDDWFSLPSSAHRAILRHKLFIAAVGTKGDNDAEE